MIALFMAEKAGFVLYDVLPIVIVFGLGHQSTTRSADPENKHFLVSEGRNLASTLRSREVMCICFHFQCIYTIIVVVELKLSAVFIT